MKPVFLLIRSTNDETKRAHGLNLVVKSDYFNLYSNEGYKTIDKTIVIIDGYVIPRNSIYQEYNNYDQYQLVYLLYKKYGHTFPNYLKGFFCILIANNNECIIINDIHSVKRCFIATWHNEWYISNYLTSIQKIISFPLDPYAPAIHATIQHFIGGRTMFKGLEYSQPASFILINEKGKIIRTYFDASVFIESNKSITDIETFIYVFEDSIEKCIKFLTPQKISATLTGGRDTRSILSVLMHLGINPHCFTFGFPTGIDVITAKHITDISNLGFLNHYIEDLKSKTYGNLVNEIISLNNPFIHLHRAHRLDAIKKENFVMEGKLDMVFIGAMGGDYIIGSGFDDYILTEFLRRYLTESTPEHKIVEEILQKHYINYNSDIVDFIIAFLNSFGIKHKKFNKNVEFNLVHNIIGCTHDIQDINLFMEHSKFVIAPYMDLDIMEALFSSSMSLFSNNKHTKNPFKRLRGGELQCSLIKAFTPGLADIKFANQYTPNDFLGNRLFYVLKRIYLQSFKIISKPTFRYNGWFLPYVDEKLIEFDSLIDQYYDISRMIKDLRNSTHETHEGYWHKYTNPITLALYTYNQKV